MTLLTLFLLSVGLLCNNPHPEVFKAVQDAIFEAGYEIGCQDETIIITKITEIDVKTINQYIIEEFPDENPGWTQARVQIFIRLKEIDAEKIMIELNAGFERFGTPSALLLIPPEWRSTISNGNFEKELLDKITKILSTQEDK